jgi:hypothetical protein
MYKWYQKSAVQYEKYLNLPEEKRQGCFPIGVFSDNDQPGLEERYEELRRSLAGGDDK